MCALSLARCCCTPAPGAGLRGSSPAVPLLPLLLSSPTHATPPIPADAAGDPAVTAAAAELDSMRAAEERLDGQLEALWDGMRAMAEPRLNKERLYVTDSDVMGLPTVAPTDQVRPPRRRLRHSAAGQGCTRVCLLLCCSAAKLVRLRGELTHVARRPQVVAVLAPHGTTLEVPEPDQGLAAGGARRYRCATVHPRAAGGGRSRFGCRRLLAV